jgi:3-hydroxypropanoate dehydrogenase
MVRYGLLAARALALDSGFEARLSTGSFCGTNIRSSFLCSLGHGNRAGVLPQSPVLL